MSKRKNFYKKLVLHTDNNTLQLAILFVCFIVLLSYYFIAKLDVLTLFDLTIISTVIITFIATISFETIINRLRPLVEDDIKLDYSFPFEKTYPLTYQKFYTDFNGHTWPIEILFTNEQFAKIKVIDSKHMYQLPVIIQQNMNYLLKLNQSSSITNNKMIRIDDVYTEDNSLIIKSSRTTYLNTLLTNRSIDSKLFGEITTRNYLDPGPFITPLKDSLLSNHLGFNLIIQTNSDDYVFIQRSAYVSTAKNKISVSVSGSVKCKYALNSSLSLDKSGIENSINNEILDELGLDKNNINIDLDKHVVAFYREMIEGGKPHLFLIVETDLDNSYIEKSFYNKVLEKQTLEKDGKEIIFLSKNELNKIRKYHTVDINKKKFYFAETTLGIISYFIDK